MKVFKYVFLTLLLSVTLLADSINLGNSAFFNDEGVINIAADAAVAVRNLDSSYLMLYLYMSVDEGESATVRREDIVLVHNDKEYEMPKLTEFRKNYPWDSRDSELYMKLGKEALALSNMRFYRFNAFDDFFPEKASGKIPLEQGFMSGHIGFRSSVYFKNPGLEPGDMVVIKVKDQKNPSISGSVAVELAVL